MVVQVVVTVDTSNGQLNVAPPDGIPLPVVVGWMETGKFILLNNLANGPKAPPILPASAGDLDQINRSRINGAGG